MTPTIKRLQETLFTEIVLNENNLLATSLDKITYKAAASRHQELNLEFSFLAQQINRNASALESMLQNAARDEPPVEQIEKLQRQLKAFIFLANVLEPVYRDYLLVPRDVARIQKQRQACELLLKACDKLLTGDILSDPYKEEMALTQGSVLSQEIRFRTGRINLLRLLTNRLLRLHNSVVIFIAHEPYKIWARQLDQYGTPSLAIINWLFYFPRFFTNIGILIKHVFFPTAEEKSLGIKTRATIQLQRRWFELFNDLPWIITSFLNCFIFIGPLAPVGVYLATAVFAYDIILAIGRIYFDLMPLIELRKAYRDLYQEGKITLEELDEHLQVLDKQILFQKLVCFALLASTILVFLSMCCVTPLMAFSPVIPLIGALGLIASSLGNITLVPIIERYRPKDAINSFRFFKSIPRGSVQEPSELSPPDSSLILPQA